MEDTIHCTLDPVGARGALLIVPARALAIRQPFGGRHICAIKIGRGRGGGCTGGR